PFMDSDMSPLMSSAGDFENWASIDLPDIKRTDDNKPSDGITELRALSATQRRLEWRHIV
ncbi:hypothetical protein V490_09024, partial [Pseudogymnoascus sp. VKM F-3557]